MRSTGLAALGSPSSRTSRKGGKRPEEVLAPALSGWSDRHLKAYGGRKDDVKSGPRTGPYQTAERRSRHRAEFWRWLAGAFRDLSVVNHFTKESLIHAGQFWICSSRIKSGLRSASIFSDHHPDARLAARRGRGRRLRVEGCERWRLSAGGGQWSRCRASTACPCCWDHGPIRSEPRKANLVEKRVSESAGGGS